MKPYLAMFENPLAGPGRFTHFEVMTVAEFEVSGQRFVEPYLGPEMDLSQDASWKSTFVTLYGRLEHGVGVAIGDFDEVAGALKILRLIGVDTQQPENTV